MKKRTSFILTGILLITSPVWAGNVKKVFVNVAKEGSQAQSSDIPSHYNNIENVQKTIVYDFSGSGSPHGTPYNLTKKASVDGTFGQSYDFNKTGYVNVNTAAQLNTPTGFTVEAWLYRLSRNPSGPDHPIVSKSVTSEFSGNGDWKFFYGWGNDLYFCIKGYCTIGRVSDDLNRWHHVAATYDGTTKTMKIYADGKLNASRSDVSISNIGTNNQNIWIGRAVRQGGYFHGQIDEVRLWNRALTEKELLQNMEEPLQGKQNGLVGYWNFD